MAVDESAEKFRWAHTSFAVYELHPTVGLISCDFEMCCYFTHGFLLSIKINFTEEQTA